MMTASRFAFAAITVVGACAAMAAEQPASPPQKPVLEVIRGLNRPANKKPNEVTVVLDPVGQPLAPTIPATPANKPEPTPAKEPKPVEPPQPDRPPAATGQAPEGVELLPASPPAAPGTTQPPRPASPGTHDLQGLAVQVETMQPGNGLTDPAQVKLLAPFPAKPLAQAPAGWRIAAAPEVPAVTRKVELAPGQAVTLSIRPAVLQPDADGANVFSVPEPGFDPALGYHQASTVGTILSQSLRQLEDDSIALGNAIDQLQQLLVSLPKPAATPPVAQPVTPPHP